MFRTRMKTLDSLSFPFDYAWDFPNVFHRNVVAKQNSVVYYSNVDESGVTVLKVELPGVKKSDLSATLVGDMDLRLDYTRDNKRNTVVINISEISVSVTDVKFEDGLLTVTAEPLRPKRPLETKLEIV
jgi:HSP20 family molecular chaperone IbpA